MNAPTIDTLLADYNQTRDNIIELQLLLHQKRSAIAKRLRGPKETEHFRYTPYVVGTTKVRGYTRKGYRAFRLSYSNPVNRK